MYWSDMAMGSDSGHCVQVWPSYLTIVDNASDTIESFPHEIRYCSQSGGVDVWPGQFRNDQWGTWFCPPPPCRCRPTWVILMKQMSHCNTITKTYRETYKLLAVQGITPFEEISSSWHPFPKNCQNIGPTPHRELPPCVIFQYFPNFIEHHILYVRVIRFIWDYSVY